MTDRSFLSIGDVLALLRDEFPDVTISKIRFLESRGLLDPERTPSGYRKFYDADVERLRWILRQQRENFLPLKVIKGRLEGSALEEPQAAPRLFDPPDRSDLGAPPPRRESESGSEVESDAEREEAPELVGAAVAAQKVAAAPGPGSGAPAPPLPDTGGSPRALSLPPGVRPMPPRSPRNGDDTAAGRGPSPSPAAPAGRPATEPRSGMAAAAEYRAHGEPTATGSSGRVAEMSGHATESPAPARPVPATPTAKAGTAVNAGDPVAGGVSAAATRAGGGRADREPEHARTPAGARTASPAGGPAAPGAGVGAGAQAGRDAGATATPPAGTTAPAAKAPSFPPPAQRPAAFPAPSGGAGAPAAESATRASTPASKARAIATGVSMTIDELADAVGMTTSEVDRLEDFGFVASRQVAGVRCFDEEDLLVARLAAAFARHGIEPRHLKTFKHAAERQADLLAQLVMPLLRQRNPQARQKAGELLAELSELASNLQAALLATSLRDLTGG